MSLRGMLSGTVVGFLALACSGGDGASSNPSTTVEGGGGSAGVGGSGGTGSAGEASVCGGAAESDLSDLQQLAAHSLLVQEDDGETWGTGELYWRAPDGAKTVVAGTWDNWDHPSISPNRRRLLFFRGNGQGRSGVPRIIQLTEQGATPLRALDGNVEFSNGIAAESWTPDSRYFSAWGYVIGESDESVGVYDTATERLVGSVPVTSTGSLSDPVGCLVRYRSDRETEKAGIFAIQQDGLSEPRLLEEGENLIAAADGGIWTVDADTGEIFRAPHLTGEFVSLATISGAESVRPFEDGQGAFVLALGTLSSVSLSGEVRELLTGVMSTSIFLGSGLVARLDDESAVYVDAAGSQSTGQSLGPVRKIRTNHALDIDSGVILGSAPGQVGTATVAPGITNSLCASEFEYGPDQHFVLNYSTAVGEHLAFIDLSQPEAQLLLTIDAAAGENFSCAAHSIDGTRVSFVRRNAAGSTIVTVDWTTTLGEPVEVYSSENRLAVHAQL